jgi:hypothetical protein
MGIYHKFLNHNFDKDFETRNSILETVPYEPETIFIGTFNHGWEWNQADFFYGRGMYFWPILANLFIYNNNELISRRSLNNDTPNFEEILEICKTAKITFADIVKGTSEGVDCLTNEVRKAVLVGDNYQWNDYKDGHLDNLGNRGWLDDNVTDIINYINKTKTIKNVYFTFKSGNWIVNKKNQILAGIRNDVEVSSIFTPTANGFRENLEAPFNERAWSLTHCWLWNGLEHDILVNKPDYGNLNHDWLISKGVDVNNF